MTKLLTESFNARYMTFEEVANTFIRTSDFDKLIQCNHTILMGSRGCGKTTLLKMLHPEALHTWNSDDSEKFKETIPFYGIYIPTDRQWGSQILNFENTFKNKKDFARAISRGLVNLNIFIAICNTFKSLLNISNNDVSINQDISLSLALVEVWKIPKPITPNLYSITKHFQMNVSDLNAIVKKADTSVELPTYCYYDYFDMILLGVNAFEYLFSDYEYFKSKAFRWALCFDELEIAPTWLYDELYDNCLRSKDQKILFKMTTTPVDSKTVVPALKFSPNIRDDFEIIKMWVYDTRSLKSWREFCDKYLNKLLNNRFKKNITSVSIFGENDYHAALNESESFKFAKLKGKEDTEFSENGYMWQLFKELAKIDRGFHEYLLKKRIDPGNPIPLYPEQINSVHRKIKPIALYRYYFRKNIINNVAHFRSRKVSSYNHGREYIYDVADGNSRAFVNLIRDFVPLIQFDNKGNVKRIKINDQAKVIEKFSEEFYYPKIAYYPNSYIYYNQREITLKSVVDCIGSYFKSQYLGDNFLSDPSSFFIFDKDCPSEFRDILNIGLEAGCFLLIEDEAMAKRKGLKRYRLSYSLYPLFNLPQRAYYFKNLSSILEPIIKENIDLETKQMIIKF
jgi:hypothetical protein